MIYIKLKSYCTVYIYIYICLCYFLFYNTEGKTKINITNIYSIAESIFSSNCSVSEWQNKITTITTYIRLWAELNKKQIKCILIPYTFFLARNFECSSFFFYLKIKLLYLIWFSAAVTTTFSTMFSFLLLLLLLLHLIRILNKK